MAALATAPAHAERLMALAGVTEGSTPPNSSYGWELAFEYALSRRSAVSLAWINEGHFAQHARDGAAGQYWLNGATWWKGRLRLELGGGPYLYFDTQPSDSVRGYSDIHGVGGILSVSLAADVANKLFLDLRANQIVTSGNFSSLGLLFGVGYDFGGGPGTAAPGNTGNDQSPADGGSVLQVFGGKLISNSLSDQQSSAVGADYRIAVTRWVAWSATWFDDLEGGAGLHQRLATQIWLLDHPFGHRLTFGVGLGPYVLLGALPSGSATPSARVSGISALRVDWQFTGKLSAILAWYRTFTNDDRDRDIITVGLGWHFGSY